MKVKSAPAGAEVALSVCAASEGGGREERKGKQSKAKQSKQGDLQLDAEGTSHFRDRALPGSSTACCCRTVALYFVICGEIAAFLLKKQDCHFSLGTAAQKAMYSFWL